MENDLRAWLTLLHAGINANVDFVPLVAAYGGPGNLLTAIGRDAELRASLPAGLLREASVPQARNFAADLAWLEKPGNGIVTCMDDAYPERLKNISHPPLLLFTRGDVTLLGREQLAIVGTRKPSAYGREVAGRFAEQLADYGLTVTSGLATGIDACAHKGALRTGNTVAVLGSGFGHTYPAVNRRLAAQIAERNLLVSEFPVTYKPMAANFPRRNRIISGLSKGVLVVEGALRSGSLITARHALEQGREVFAVPGSINNGMARGCHKLIQDGAKLVQEVADIAVEFGLESPEQECPPPRKKPTNEKKLDDNEKVLLDNIGCDPVSVDELYLSTKINIDILTGKLLKLELAGHISAVAAGIYIRN